MAHIFLITWENEDHGKNNSYSLEDSKIKALKAFKQNAIEWAKEGDDFYKTVILNVEDLGEGTQEDINELVELDDTSNANGVRIFNTWQIS